MRRKDYQLEESAYYQSLFQILDALQWRGNQRGLGKFIRSSPMEMTQVDLFNTLASLRIRTRHTLLCLREIRSDNLPCLYISKRGKPFILSDLGQTSFRCVQTGELLKVSPSKRLSVFCFHRILEDERSEIDRQKNWFQRFVERFKAYGIYLFILSFVINILNLIAPLLILVVFRQIEAAKSLSHLKQVLLGLALYVSILTAVRLLRSQVLNYLAVRIGYLIATQVMRRLLYLPTSYTEVASVGGQLARIRDFDSIQQFIPGLGTDALLDGPFTIMLLLALFLLGGQLAFIPLAAMIILLVFGYLMRKRIDLAAGDSSRYGKQRLDFLMDTLNNLDQLQTQYLARFWRTRFEQISKRTVLASFKAAILNNVVSSFSYFVVTLSGVLTIVFGVDMVQSQQLDAASLMASMLLTWKLLAPVRNGFSFLLQLDKVKKSIGQVDRLMGLPQEKISEDAFEIEQSIKGDIAFQQVSLKYTSDAHPALLGVNFEVKAGELMVIIGHGGSGQTSILKLILGLYYPQAGRVLIDQKNTRQLNPNFIREHIAYLPEKVMFFSGSIRQTFEHIVPEATQTQIERVLERVGILSDIQRLSQGIETPFETSNQAGVTENLQKKVILAMMILKQSSLWLLDNPDTIQDTVDSRLVQNLLIEQKHRSTVIVATQDTSYLEIADKVLWLNSGRVQFFGPPKDLYRKLEGKIA